MSFVHDMRSYYSTIVESPSLVFDVIGFLSTSNKLHSRPLLHYVFKLACLCLTDTVAESPVVRFGAVDSSKVSCTMNKVFYPVQSYLSCVPNYVEACCRGNSVTKFLDLCDSFGRRAFDPVYSPWDDVDYYGRASFSVLLRNSFEPANEVSEQGKRPRQNRILLQSQSGSRIIPIPKRVVGRVKYGPITQKEIDIVTSGLVQGGSKD